MTSILVRICVSVLALAIGHDVANGQGVSEQKAEPRVRTVRQNSQPLRTRLLPDDQIVVVEYAFGPGLPVSFPVESPAQAVETASFHAVAAMVVDVERSESRLVEDDTWIATFTTGVIADVVRDSPLLGLRAGGHVTLVENAGELVVDGKIVRAGPPALQPFLAGSRYLVIVTVNPENKAVYPTGRWLVQPDGKLQDTMLGEKGTDWRQKLTGLSLDRVVDAFRRLERKHKVR